MKRLAYEQEQEHLDPTEHPLICKMLASLNVEWFKLSTRDRNLVITLIEVEMESFSSQADVALIPSLCGMFVDVISIVTNRAP